MRRYNQFHRLLKAGVFSRRGYGLGGFTPESHPLCRHYWKASDFDPATGTMLPTVGSVPFVQAVSGSRPSVQADGALRFDGTNDFLEAATASFEVVPGQNFTAIACWKRNGLTGFECMWGFGNSANTTDLVYAYQNALSSTNQNIATLSSSITVNIGSSKWNIGVGEIAAQAFSVANNGTNYTITNRIRGMQGSATGAQATGQDRFRIGRSPRSTGSPYAKGDFYEMGLYAGALTVEEIDRIAAAMEASHYPEPSETMDIYIVAGQSNADGKGSEANLADYSATGTEGTNIMVHQVGINSGTDQMYIPSPLAIQKRSSVDFSHGPEMTLATRLNALGRKVAILKIAVSSTSFGTSVGGDFGDWWPFADANQGSLMTSLLEKAGAMNAMVRSYGFTPRWRGIVWVHGEADGATADRRAAYEANLTEFLRRIRAVTSPSLQAVVWIPGNSARHADIVTAMNNVAANDENTVAIDAQTEGITLDTDGLHYDSLGLQEIGTTSANTFGINP